MTQPLGWHETTWPSCCSPAAWPDLFENFYAITVPRRFAPPLLRELLARPESEVLGTP